MKKYSRHKIKLKIAQVAPLWFPIPPVKYGGVERVVYALTEELVRRGHEVTLFASGDSRTSAKLIPGWPKSLFKERLYGKPIRWGHCVYPLFNFSKAFETAEKFDILHIHENSSCISNFFSKLTDTPVLTTVHDPFPLTKDKDRWHVFRKYNRNEYAALSRSHAGFAKKIGLKSVATIYNGVDIGKLPFKKYHRNYLVWVGRSAPNKGAKEAIQAARLSGDKLLLAGRIDINSPVAKEYYDKHIKPYLGKKIVYVGEVGDKKKASLMGNAKALLYPISWEEPFGLVMAEAMACGTPVIAFDRGSVRELVKNGKTGFVVRNINQMVEAIRKIDSLDRSECRRWVENKFSIDKMVNGYENLYYNILNRKD